LKKSPKLDTSVRTELEDLKAEIEAVAPLLKKLAVQEPDSIELRAVAATLHAFYNGIERVFLLIARHVDESTPQGATWHRDLLSQMTNSSTRRAPVISDALAEELSKYLGFRHFFRHAYPMRLNWEVIQHLVEQLPAVQTRTEQSIEFFLGSLPTESDDSASL
jgi:hypothetical protein